MNILVVEDEIRLADALGQILKEQRYQVDVVYDGRDGFDYGVSGQYDVIVLDVMLPYMDGFQVVNKLRKEHVNTPVLMLTAKDDLRNKIQGLDAGADDYMTKPFEPEELLARIRALSRRLGEVVIDELSFDDLTLNLSTCDLSCSNPKKGKSVHLGFKEFEVLKMLMANSPNIVPKDDLITKIWGVESGAEDNNVEAYISFLRKKFFFIGSRVQIGTVRKVGYRLEVPENA